MVELMTVVVHEYHSQQQHNTSGQSKAILFLRKITLGLCEHGENKIKVNFFSLNILHVVKDCSPTKNSPKMTLDFRPCLFCFHISLHKFSNHQRSIYRKCEVRATVNLTQDYKHKIGVCTDVSPKPIKVNDFRIIIGGQDTQESCLQYLWLSF